MLTIALLLCCFKSWCQNKVSELSFTGEIQLAPDSTCIVPIKLIERNSFTKVMQEQEDIIKLQKLELKEYSVIVGDMQNRIVSYNTINNNLNKQIEQYKKRNKILIGTSCGVIAVAALILIIK